MKKQKKYFLNAIDLVAFNMELKKILSYPLEFWANTLGLILVNILIPYCIWQAIFKARNITEMYNLSFNQFIFYFLCCYFVSASVLGAMSKGSISQEIYQGNINKFIIYPIQYLRFKFFNSLAYSFIILIELIITICVHKLIFGNQITILAFIEFLPTLILSTTIGFLLVANLELLSFWVDSVWNLQVILRLFIQMGGGLFLPLFLMSESIRHFLYFTPFPYLIYYPIGILTKFYSVIPLHHLLIIQLFWIGFLLLLAQSLWKKGLKQYSGIGI